ncbi:MAG: helix-turn-helix transcriptional regulator [Clostridia bacterium]|nr:helix-turn-helix transcriptional regulator [Clostridia bacterium]
MQIKIGANLRRLRISRDMTQEQLAEVFGVSPQAVSRWETDSACPDVTLLPGIAIFFDTTVDDILGMSAIRSEDSLRAVHCEINELVISGDAPAAAALIREYLRIYLDNPGLLMSLSETLAHIPDPAAAEEAARIAERILKNPDVSTKAKSTTAVNLIYLCLRIGRPDRARELVKSLPHIWESREMIMPEPAENDYENELKKAVGKALSYLCQRIDAAKNREYGKTPPHIQLGVDFDDHPPVSEMLTIIKEFLE